jgi:hypothetical protein
MNTPATKAKLKGVKGTSNEHREKLAAQRKLRSTVHVDGLGVSFKLSHLEVVT